MCDQPQTRTSVNIRPKWIHMRTKLLTENMTHSRPDIADI